MASSLAYKIASSAPRSSSRAKILLSTAFRTSSSFGGNSSRVASTGRLFSSMPYDDEKMPFYALGMSLAVQVNSANKLDTLLDDKELDVVLDAFCNTLKGKSTEDARAVLTTYGPKLNTIINERQSSMANRVKVEGEEYIKNFLDSNDGAVQTESGLVYYSMKEGTGKQPTTTNTVEVHYHGTLTNGTVFDSSVDRGQTISFPLGGVIKGWQEGLAMMKEGGKATLLCPADLAYGEQGSGQVIPPGATLKFEVELFKVS